MTRQNRFWESGWYNKEARQAAGSGDTSSNFSDPYIISCTPCNRKSKAQDPKAKHRA